MPVSTKSQPFSIRLRSGLDALLGEEARRTRRSKGAVLEALADEALRTRRFPGIAFRGVDWDRRAWVIGTGLDVWEIVEAYESFGSPERMLEETDLSEGQLRLALAYYAEFSQDIAEAVSENGSSLDQLRTRFPTIDVRGSG